MVHTGYPSSGTCSGGSSPRHFSLTLPVFSKPDHPSLSPLGNLPTFQLPNFPTPPRSIPALTSAFSVNGACPDPVGVLRKTSALITTDAPVPLSPVPTVCHPACPERSRRERSEGSAFLCSPQSLATKPFTICTSAKSTTNPFRLCSFKTRDLKSF